MVGRLAVNQRPWGFDSLSRRRRCGVAQWQSDRLLTGVRVGSIPTSAAPAASGSAAIGLRPRSLPRRTKVRLRSLSAGALDCVSNRTRLVRNLASITVFFVGRSFNGRILVWRTGDEGSTPSRSTVRAARPQYTRSGYFDSHSENNPRGSFSASSLFGDSQGGSWSWHASAW